MINQKSQNKELIAAKKLRRDTSGLELIDFQSKFGKTSQSWCWKYFKVTVIKLFSFYCLL